MLLDRSHRPWFWFTLLATLACVTGFVLVFYPERVPAGFRLPETMAQAARGPRLHHSVGNSPLGLAYGSVAYAIFIFAVLLGVRKKFPLLRFGRAQSWLRAHIWLTILSLPLVFLHANLRFGGPMTSTLMWLYLVVMLSGFYGLGLQQFLPRLMKTNLSLETIFEQIPYLTQQLFQAALKMREELRLTPDKVSTPAASAAVAAAALSAKKSGAAPAAAAAIVVQSAAPAGTLGPSASALLEALETDVLPYLGTRKVHPSRQRLAERRFAKEFFLALRLRVTGPFQEKADQLASWCEERRQMDLQARYHHWMHGWLLVHAPASFLLVILTGWHAVVLLFLY